MNLLKLQLALGYKINKLGMCYGIAFMAIQAIIRNKIDSYIHRINLINSYIDKYENQDKAIEALANDIDQAYKRRANKLTRQTLTPDENRLLDILAWLDGVQIYHGQDLRLLGKSRYQINYQDFQRSSDFFVGGNEECQKIFLQSKDICLLTSEKIDEILLKIKNTHKPIAFSISTSDHTIAIGKSKNVKEIFLISHDDIIILDKYNKFRIHSFFGAQNNDLITVSILEFSNSTQTHEINYFLEDISQLSNSQIKNLIYIALQYGHPTAVKAYIETILKMNININNKIKLLAAKCPNQFPGLYVALQNGHIESINIYIESILNSNIPNNFKVELLAAKNINYTPGLFLALQNEHDEIIANYLKINIPNLSDHIVYGFSKNKLMKELLLKWALKYKPNQIKKKSDYPLLINILSYNRYIFEKNPTESTKALNACNYWV
ncbi:ankyrin repeat domain-containing protein [Francisella sp. LA112445]|uniref:ankyrin repeat domain-containing protein n=1 Tax=Francisella sp. LA112445 TaxID=1395624 RepID=UPI001788D9DB|nr:ankyrin repeat domain-containing protein [Francisella sp. LA112445]QIW09715.1 ankyrin repeat domain-containing protein [Francisella sp. LA112445]